MKASSQHESFLISEQVINWIITNQYIYLSSNVIALIQIYEGYAQHSIKTFYHKVIALVGPTIFKSLCQQQPVCIHHFGIFYTQNNSLPENQSKIQIRFRPEGQLQIKMLKKYPITSDIKIIIQRATQSQQNLYRQISSLLLIDSQNHLIQDVITAYIKAIHDLLSSGKRIKLDFNFIKMQISGNAIMVKIFKEIPIKEKSIVQKARQGSILLKDKENEIYDEIWKETLNGAYYQLPYLRSIKDHYEKGLDLQLKTMRNQMKVIGKGTISISK